MRTPTTTLRRNPRFAWPLTVIGGAILIPSVAHAKHERLPPHALPVAAGGRSEPKIDRTKVPSASDHFPDTQTNIVPILLSMGAYNCLQQSDCHAYWEFNYTTNWIHPLYELPFTGGMPGTFEAGQIGALSSLIPGSGPNGIKNDPVRYGDNPIRTTTA